MAMPSLGFFARLVPFQQPSIRADLLTTFQLWQGRFDFPGEGVLDAEFPGGGEGVGDDCIVHESFFTFRCGM